MQTGLDALRNAIKEGKDRQNGTGGGYLRWVTWKPGDRKIVRFLDDGLIIGDYYNGIVGKDGKTTGFLVDPEKGDFIQKYGARGVDWRGQVVAEPKTRKMAAGVVVLREEIPSREGRGVDLVDHLFDLDIQGTGYPARYYGVVLQTLKLFWDQLGYLSQKYGTLTDRDYEIVREGEKLDTKYRIFPCDPDDDLKDLQDLHANYGYGREWPKKPEDGDSDEVKQAWQHRFLYCPQTINQWADQYSSEDRVKRWLFGDENSTATQAPNPAAPKYSPSDSNDEAQVASLSTSTDFESLRAHLTPHMKNK